MRLNVRAITQLLRDRGIEVGKTSHKDMEMEDPSAQSTDHDAKIFERGAVRGWEFINTDIKEMMDIDEDEAERSGDVAKVSINGTNGDAANGTAMKEIRETADGIVVS